MMRSMLVMAIVLAWSGAADAQEKQQRQRDLPPPSDAREHVYKRVGDVQLKLYVFEPEGHTAKDRRPAVVFFFGGGWTGGSTGQFLNHSRYLATRGVVAITVDYRVASRHGVKAIECVKDAKSAIRWVRANAARLGVNPEQIAAAGGSAGGHLAACTALIGEYDESGEDLSVSSRPNAMVLFNPALVLAAVEGEGEARRVSEPAFADRMGIEPAKLSPYHRVAPGAPPAIIFHGKNDTTVPYRTAELFAEAMKKAGNYCELVGYEGAAHGFFNFGRSPGNRDFVDTVKRMDGFLLLQGWISGADTVDEFMEQLR